MSIVNAGYYYLPTKEMLDALEGIAQGVVTNLYEMCLALYGKMGLGNSRSFGDADYTFWFEEVEDGPGDTFTRLCFKNHAGGWWAVFQWGADWHGQMQFWQVSETGEMPDKVDWNQAGHDHDGERCLWYMQARIPKGKTSWYSSFSNLNFNFSITMYLGLALEELGGKG